MPTIRRFEEIEAWQRARALVREVYATCAGESLRRDFGMRDQLCRAAVSIMSNIAEGYGRGSNQDFARMLDIARGSAAEVQSLLYVAFDVGHIDEASFSRLYALADQTTAMIARFSAYLRASAPQTNGRRPNAERRTPNAERTP